MRVGIATDHGGFELKEDLKSWLHRLGHVVVDFGARELQPMATIIPISSYRSHRPWRRERWTAASRFAEAASGPRSARIKFRVCVQAWCRTTTRPTRVSNMTT